MDQNSSKIQQYLSEIMEKKNSLCANCQRRRHDPTDNEYYCAIDLREVTNRNIIHCDGYIQKENQLINKKDE